MATPDNNKGFERLGQAYMFPDGLQIIPVGKPETNHNIGSTITLFTISVEGLSSIDLLTGSITTYPLGSSTAPDTARTAAVVQHYNEDTPGTTASVPDDTINHLHLGPELLDEGASIIQLARLTRAVIAMSGLVQQQ